MNRAVVVRRAVPLVLLFGVLLVAARVEGGNPTDPRRVSQITASQAVAAVQSFDSARAADVAVQRTVDGALGRAYEVAGSSVSALVDVFDGRIVLFEVTGAVEATGRANITSAGAQQVAQTFLSAHRIPVDGLGEPLIEAEDHGDVSTVTITWQRVSPSGVLLPDERIVHVNPSTAQVTGFLDLRRPFIDPPAPQISQEQAGSIAAAAAGVGDVRQSQLLVTFSASGEQLLVWRLWLRDDAPNSPTIQAAVVDIDASTGSVIQVAPAL
jgi:hypothetical protein